MIYLPTPPAACWLGYSFYEEWVWYGKANCICFNTTRDWASVLQFQKLPLLLKATKNRNRLYSHIFKSQRIMSETAGDLLQFCSILCADRTYLKERNWNLLPMHFFLLSTAFQFLKMWIKIRQKRGSDILQVKKTYKNRERGWFKKTPNTKPSKQQSLQTRNYFCFGYFLISFGR